MFCQAELIKPYPVPTVLISRPSTGFLVTGLETPGESFQSYQLSKILWLLHNNEDAFMMARDAEKECGKFF